jgi:xylan 1,4-beta-xylosidase
MAGLSIYGNAANAIGISVADGRAIAWRRQKNAQQSLAAANVPHGDAVHLRITARNGARFEFAMSPDGQQWRTVGDAAEGGHLPPWDLAVRIGLVVGGPAGSEASFDWLRVEQAPTSHEGPRAPR